MEEINNTTEPYRFECGNITVLVKKMGEIADAAYGGNTNPDFHKYDVPSIYKAADEDLFPLIWNPYQYGTHASYLGGYDTAYFEDETERYLEAQCVNPFMISLKYMTLDSIYLVEREVTGRHKRKYTLRIITKEQAREVIRDICTPIRVEWKQNADESEQLPDKFKVKVSLFGIKPHELIKLFKEEERYNSTKLRDYFRGFQRLAQMGRSHHINVHWGGKRDGFYFEDIYKGIVRYNGGLVFHGWPDTGYMQNGSVQLDPCYGWSKHT